MFGNSENNRSVLPRFLCGLNHSLNVIVIGYDPFPIMGERYPGSGGNVAEKDRKIL